MQISQFHQRDYPQPPASGFHRPKRKNAPARGMVCRGLSLCERNPSVRGNRWFSNTSNTDHCILFPAGRRGASGAAPLGVYAIHPRPSTASSSASTALVCRCANNSPAYSASRLPGSRSKAQRVRSSPAAPCEARCPAAPSPTPGPSEGLSARSLALLWPLR